jgi:HK97 family phage major capsid protein
MANVIADLIGQRIGRALNRQCTTGNGVGTATGLVTSATLGKTAALQTAFSLDELIQLMHSVEVDYRNANDGCGWMFHDNVAA